MFGETGTVKIGGTSTNDIDVWELYDLQEDPHEMNNLYGKPSYEAVTKRMRDELYKLQKQYDDPVGIRFNVSD